MDSQTLIGIFGAGGAGAVLLALVRGLIERWNGAHDRELELNANAIRQRDDAWAERDRERDRADRERDRADAEARHARIMAEYASQLRAMLIERGASPDDLPTRPARRH